MSNHQHSQFERGIVKVVAIIGLVRFSIALIGDISQDDGPEDLFLDIVSWIMFLGGLLLIQYNARNRWIAILFFVPLMVLQWLSFYFFNGIASSVEINAFAIVIIFSLTSKGWVPLILTSAFIIGLFGVEYIVEPDNINNLPESEYYTHTFTLLFVSLAIIWLLFYSKNVFTSSRNRLHAINKELQEKGDEITEKNELLVKQNHALNLLKKELEEKVLERAERLHQQKDNIEEYLKLTLSDLKRPYERTINAINQLEDTKDDKLMLLIKDSGKKLEVEMKNLKDRLTDTHD